MNKLKQKFTQIFGTEPQVIVRSPGRINLIGEHTDYNGGLVMPAAVDKYIFAAIAKRKDHRVRIYSLDFDQFYEQELAQLSPLPQGRWENYVLGVVAQMQEQGAWLRGFDLAITGNVPIGAGMSSSAALENAVAFALNELFDLGFDRRTLALISQKAEHTYARVRCGIMDQFASMFGKKDRFLLLDTQTLSYEYLQLPLEEYQLILLNTSVKHELGASVYNERRQLCEHAAARLGVRYLCQATLQDLERIKHEFSPEDFAALEYVLEENLRVKQMKQAILNRDFQQIGKLLLDSHWGLSKKYRVSCAELDFLVQKAEASAWVVGARMMGGGFGGCTINLVQRGRAEDFYNSLRDEYAQRFGKEPELIQVEIVDGVERV